MTKTFEFIPSPRQDLPNLSDEQKVFKFTEVKEAQTTEDLTIENLKNRIASYDNQIVELQTKKQNDLDTLSRAITALNIKV